MIYFSREIDLIRSLNTIVVLAAALELDILNLFLDRISTHPTENRIGIIRTTSQSQHTESRAFSTLAKSALITESSENIGIKTATAKRTNNGGARVDSSTCIVKININESLVDDFFRIMYSKPQLSIIKVIIHELQNLELSLDSYNALPKLYNISPISSGSIIQRIIAFNKDSDPKKRKNSMMG